MDVKHLYINTIGCQMNVYDSERMAALMAPVGYVTTDSVRAADLIVVNTCTIREKAEQKAFSFLGRLADLKRKNPGLIIAVGGCMAQQEGKAILRRVPFADIVFGTHALGRLPRMVERVAARRCRVVDVEMTDGIDEFGLTDDYLGSDEVSRFVTIMQGCDNFCTYCVVPYVRGREASRKPESILAEIRALVRSGVREVTLLGQNVNSYGQKESLCSFPELLERISAVEGLSRIRFTTSHPKDLSPGLIGAFRNLDKLCHHIHLPVQSGSNRVLKRMNRKYTREGYLEKIDRLRQACPDIAITSDMIVGFPGETQADFEQTLDLMRTVAYDGLFAFKYSDRPNAPAARFDDKVAEPEQNDRLQALLDLQEQYTLRRNQALVGTTPWVLVDGFGKRQTGDGAVQWSGRTGGNKIVNFVQAPGTVLPGRTLMGRMVQVEIREAFTHSLRGRPVTDAPPTSKGEDSHAA